MAKHFLHFDEIEDVLSSLDLLALTVPLVKKQPSYWKWVLVASHSSLQGAMVCALRDTAGISILASDARVSHQHFGRVNGGANDSRQSSLLDGPSFRYEVRKLIPKFPMQTTHILRLRLA
jgi:hypothetical protein